MQVLAGATLAPTSGTAAAPAWDSFVPGSVAGRRDDSPGTSPETTRDPTVSVSPAYLTLSSGARGALVAAVVPCGVAWKTVWSATDTSVAKVIATGDTSALVTGGRTGHTSVVVSVAALPPATAIAVIEVK